MANPTTSDEIRELVTTIAATVRAGMSITEIMELFNDMLLALESAADTIDALTAELAAVTSERDGLRSENASQLGIIVGLEDAINGRVKTFDTIDEMLAEVNTPEPTPPASAPSAAPASETTATDDVDARPIEAGDTIRIKGFESEHLVHSIGEDGRINLWTGTTFTQPEYAELVKKGNPAPASAAPDASVAAAKEALRGHTFEKPKAAKLTVPQRDLLDKAAKSLPYAHVLMERDGAVLRTMKSLEKRNLITVHKSFHHGVELWQFDCTITEKGRAALEGRAK